MQKPTKQRQNKIKQCSNVQTFNLGMHVYLYTHKKRIKQ